MFVLCVQVCKVPSTASLLIYDFNMFRQQLQLALEQRHSYEQLYQLTQLCHISLGFVKGLLADSDSSTSVHELSTRLLVSLTSSTYVLVLRSRLAID